MMGRLTFILILIYVFHQRRLGALARMEVNYYLSLHFAPE